MEINREQILLPNGNITHVFTPIEIIKLYLKDHNRVKPRLHKILQKLGGTQFANTLTLYSAFTKFTPAELETIKSGKFTKLGKGSYGTVYVVNGRYAVKVIEHSKSKNFPLITGEHEAKMIKYLTNRIVYKMISPCIVPLFQYTRKGRTDYLVMEKMNTTFHNYIIQKPSLINIKSIIFQVVFTLAVLQKTIPSFRHNDLKCDNILVQPPVNSSTELSFEIKNKKWQLSSTAPIAYFADFDYSHCKGVYNPRVDTKYAQNFGCGPEKSEIYDIHLFLNSMYHRKSNLNTETLNFINRNLPFSVRGTENKHLLYNRLRNPQEWTRKIKTPIQLLNDPYFDTLKKLSSTAMWGL